MEKALGNPGAFSRFMSNRRQCLREPLSAETDLLICDFLEWGRVERTFASETIVTYRRSLDRFFRESGVAAVEHLSLSDVLRFKRLLLDRDCSPSYIAVIVLALRTFLTYCRTVRGIEAMDPKTVTPPKRPRRAVTYLTPGEVARFVSG
jgi:site-specific recombinase XerD